MGEAFDRTGMSPGALTRRSLLAGALATLARPGAAGAQAWRPGCLRIGVPDDIHPATLAAVAATLAGEPQPRGERPPGFRRFAVPEFHAFPTWGSLVDHATLRNPDGKVTVGGPPLRIGGPGAALVNLGDEPAPGGTGKDAGIIARDPGARRTLAWMGRDGRTVEVASRSMADAFAEAFLLTLTGRSPDGTLTTQFAGMVHWTRAQPEAQAVLVDLVPFAPPTGFQRPPSATFERRGDRLVLILSFTPVALGPGQLTIG